MYVHVLFHLLYLFVEWYVLVRIQQIPRIIFVVGVVIGQTYSTISITVIVQYRTSPTMMIADFHPTILTPLSHYNEQHTERLVPRAPRPCKRRSERVTSLLMENLELFQSPVMASESDDVSPNKKLCLQLHPRMSESASSALFLDALERLRQKGSTQLPHNVLLSPKRRQAPRLPEAAARRESNSSSSDISTTKVDMERTPIRAPPERSHSGLARCA